MTDANDLKELLEVFAAETREGFEKLSKGLVVLEQDPGRKGLIHEIFRLVHSLKGSARMLGFVRMEHLAHEMENLLGLARSQALTLASRHIDALYAGLDKLQEYSARIQASQSEAGVEDAVAIERLRSVLSPAEEESPPAKSGPRTGKKKIGEGKPQASLTSPPSVSGAPAEDLPSSDSSPETRGIETVRLPVATLNRLMKIMEELLAVRITSEKLLDDLEEVAEQMEAGLARSTELLGSRQSMTPDDMEESLRAMSGYNEDVHRQLEAVGKHWDEVLLRFGFITQRFKEEIGVAQLLPFASITSAFPRLVRDIGAQQHKVLDFVIEGEDTPIDRSLLERLKDPIVHLLRNAVDHGIESPEDRRRAGKTERGEIRLKAATDASFVVITIRDDGIGLNFERIREIALKKRFMTAEQASEATADDLKKLLFLPGFSTAAMITDISGRGVGMDVVQDCIRSMQGKLDVQTRPGEGTTFVLSFPLSLTTRTCVLVEAGGLILALPCLPVMGITHLAAGDVSELKGEPTFIYDKFPLPLAALDHLLGIGTAPLKSRSSIPVMIASSHAGSVGLAVDRILGTQELVIKPLPRFLETADLLEGCTILADGTPSFILNVERLILQASTKSFIQAKDKSAIVKHHRVLIVEDSPTTQTMLKNLLLSMGFTVGLASDGVEGLERTRQEAYDLVLTDIEMPSMDGFELTRALRGAEKTRNIPIVLVTSLASEEDKRRGVEAGADAYITKAGFDQDKLLDVLQRLL